MPSMFPRPQWLATARFYEIYPQSFADSNGDGIGDIPGIVSRLDYIRDLGCNALWINPCFDSPFKDAGYDVRNYLKVAPRYGTNDDLITLFDEAHRRGMHVLLDLVPGHTSEEHPWFRISSRAERNQYSDRYIWTDSWMSGADGLPFVGGEAPRDGTYVLNFFKCQPALNYGFAHPERPWQMGV
ncbi:alpha-amylase family glycosyl hydrolase, partial [Bifidobacterium pullorum]|uniref:alpha-amylase family glycosyl hydrolase n=3 Tax=Bifidobacterium TaxID=1678 RepID=UPI00243037D0